MAPEKGAGPGALTEIPTGKFILTFTCWACVLLKKITNKTSRRDNFFFIITDLLPRQKDVFEV
jgi:hypothetical protein